MMAKGGDFERELCYLLSKWWTGRRDRLVFWRTSNSGGGATVRDRKGIRNRSHAGDITSTEKTSRWFTRYVGLELKKGYGGNGKRGAKGKGNLHDLIDRTNQNSLFMDWIAQARSAQKRANARHWMLIHKRDFRQTMTYFPARMYAELCLLGCFEEVKPPFIAVTVELPGDETISFIGMELDRFLGYVDPDDVRRLVKLGRAK